MRGAARLRPQILPLFALADQSLNRKLPPEHLTEAPAFFPLSRDRRWFPHFTRNWFLLRVQCAGNHRDAGMD